MNTLHGVSIMLEVVVMALGIMMATIKKKFYGWLIALTFLIYVFYDLSNYLNLNVPRSFLSVIFFIATVSILVVVGWIFKKG
ncbi:hypothetical protein KAX02_00970 [candidate division WOR-3 bacterium]|nr:hypothetical protein [candidate division WOR-3 bacterium]